MEEKGIVAVCRLPDSRQRRGGPSEQRRGSPSGGRQSLSHPGRSSVWTSWNQSQTSFPLNPSQPWTRQPPLRVFTCCGSTRDVGEPNAVYYFQQMGALNVFTQLNMPFLCPPFSRHGPRVYTDEAIYFCFLFLLLTLLDFKPPIYLLGAYTICR